jgi:hypothetical protein
MCCGRLTMPKDRDRSGVIYTKLERLDYIDGEFIWALSNRDGKLCGRANLALALAVMHRLLEIFFQGARVVPFRPDPGEGGARRGSYPIHG